MAQPGPEERRRAERLAVELRVELKHLGRPQEGAAELTRDISSGGVFVDTSVALSPQTEVTLEVSSGNGEPPLMLRAVVVRVEAQPAQTGSRSTVQTRGMGLRFLEPEAQSKQIERLNALAKEMQANHAAGAKSKRR